MDYNKPHKGTLKDWDIRYYSDRPYVVGRFVDHPQFAGRWGHTSYLVGNCNFDTYEDIEIETLNSRYTLKGQTPCIPCQPSSAACSQESSPPSSSASGPSAG